MVARDQRRPRVRRRVQRPVSRRRHHRLRHVHAGLGVHLQQPERDRRMRVRHQLHRLSGAVRLSRAGRPPPVRSRGPFFLPCRRPYPRGILHSLDLVVVGLYFVFTLGVGLWVVPPPAQRLRLLPRRPRPAGLGHPALDRRHRDLGPHRHLDPRYRRPRRPDLPAAHARIPDRAHRRRALAAARLFPWRPGDGLRPARVALRRRHPAAHLARSSSSPAFWATRCASSPARSRSRSSPAGACRRRSS